METIKLIIEASEGSIIEQSEEFTVDENWKENSDLMFSLNRMTKVANMYTRRWQSHGEEFTAKVEVEILGSKKEGSFLVAKQIQSFADEKVEK